MTDSVRHGEYSPASSGTAFAPRRPASATDTAWNGDHVDGHQAQEGVPLVDELGGTGSDVGIDPVELTDDDLVREMHSLHRTRLDTLRHGTDAALATHLRRTVDLETEYRTRHPGREVDPARLRDGG